MGLEHERSLPMGCAKGRDLMLSGISMASRGAVACEADQKMTEACYYAKPADRDNFRDFDTELRRSKFRQAASCKILPPKAVPALFLLFSSANQPSISFSFCFLHLHNITNFTIHSQQQSSHKNSSSLQFGCIFLFKNTKNSNSSNHLHPGASLTHGMLFLMPFQRNCSLLLLIFQLQQPFFSPQITALLMLFLPPSLIYNLLQGPVLKNNSAAHHSNCNSAHSCFSTRFILFKNSV
ncbi:hypothetical protein MA16_Dca027023 [Dendrobium catenatum]|uniref:Uncharacterized protein n=1 Tax=Dendrobium catenatum TaxID=906689 RepID=A0A2I0WRH9_9ASPA|nr:hypothetical protein MA16_Dca027023 [Dendrobium catenatum]